MMLDVLSMFEVQQMVDRRGQFPFLSLPSDIRKIIYSLVVDSMPTFVTPAQHHITYVQNGERGDVQTVSNHIFDSQSAAHSHLSEYHRNVPKGLQFLNQPGICFANKQLRKEVLPIYHHVLTELMHSSMDTSKPPKDYGLKEILTYVHVQSHLELDIFRIPVRDLWRLRNTIILSASSLLEMIVSYL